MSAATKNKPVDSSPAAPANEPAFGSGGAKPPVEFFMTPSQFDDIHRDLRQANAVTRALVHVFGGDANLREPSNVNGLFGSLQTAVRLMASVNQALQHHNAPTGQLSLNAQQAQALLELVEHLQVADDFEWRWSDEWFCDYFDAASYCIERAMKAMDLEVKIRKAAA